ncbi:hypothetical protein ACLOJK_017505 [Asimina triloba]
MRSDEYFRLKWDSSYSRLDFCLRTTVSGVINRWLKSDYSPKMESLPERKGSLNPTYLPDQLFPICAIKDLPPFPRTPPFARLSAQAASSSHTALSAPGENRQSRFEA